MPFFECDPIFKIGERVEFHWKVFKPPYTPYYDEYKQHMFEVIALHYENTHVELECVDNPKIYVDGYVHPDELVRV